MATPFTHGSLRSCILQLPPSIRIAALQSRSFSSTPCRKLSVLDFAIAGPNAVISGIHSLGIPWWAAIPLSAVFARGIVGYYVASKPARRQVITRTLLSPLINAQADIIRYTKYYEETRAAQDSRAVARIFQGLWIEFRARFFAADHIARPYGAPNFTGTGFFNFGMLLAFSEAIRLKCGCREGLLPLILTPFERIAQFVNPERFPKPVEAEAKTPAEFLAERLEAQRQAGTAAEAQQTASSGTSRASEILSGQDVGTTTQLEPLSSDIEATSAYFDPSMLSEGTAWFTNLALPDATLALPSVLALTMLSAAVFRPRVGKSASARKRPEDENASTDADRVSTAPRALYHRSENPLDSIKNDFYSMEFGQRLGIWVSGLFFFAAMNMPVAILLYFIPSIAIGWLQSRWLDIKYPLPQPIQKCQRPMRLKSRRQWRDAR